MKDSQFDGGDCIQMRTDPSDPDCSRSSSFTGEESPVLVLLFRPFLRPGCIVVHLDGDEIARK